MADDYWKQHPVTQKNQVPHWGQRGTYRYNEGGVITEIPGLIRQTYVPGANGESGQSPDGNQINVTIAVAFPPSEGSARHSGEVRCLGGRFDMTLNIVLQDCGPDWPPA